MSGALLYAPDGKPSVTSHFGVWTRSPVDPNNPAQYAMDLEAGRLGIGIETDHYDANNQPVRAAHYFMTSRWASRQWSFSRESLVWMSTCESASAAATPFMQTCVAKGAGLYSAGRTP